jgi:hypothetical protein
MEKEEIKEELKRLVRVYMNSEIISELEGCAMFFKKSEIIQPEESITKEDILKLSNLVVDIQRIKERVVYILIRVRKAKNRMKTMRKIVMNDKQVYEEYKKKKNIEERDLYLYNVLPSLEDCMDRSILIEKNCDTILELLNSHVWALKGNVKVLSDSYQARGE